HESEVPEPGDFKTDTLAGRPIIISRDADGQVHLLYNACRHRGAMVCVLPKGNASFFRCPYHAWTYKPDGKLALVPSQYALGPDFDLSDHPLVPVARVESYQGFIFASLAPEGPSLREHLGRATHYIDLFVERAPNGVVRATKPLKYEYPGNWKLQMDNMADNYHAEFTHASAFTIRPDALVPRTNGFTSNGSYEDQTDRNYPTGKTFGPGIGCAFYHGGRQIVSDPDRYPDYLAALAKAHGEERARELAGLHFHLMIYPNLILHPLYSHYRVIRPLAVDHTEINVYPCTLDGAPEVLNEALIRAAALHVSAGGQVQVDDLEAFTRVQEGLKTEAFDWLLFKMGGEETDNEYGERETKVLSEMIPRGFYREWRRLMAQP